MSSDTIKLSHAVQHALVAMVHLSYGSDSHQAKRRELVHEFELTPNFSQAILRTLVQRGLLVSMRGPSGGYRLARPADEITVADVIRAIDGPIACESAEVKQWLQPSSAKALQLRDLTTAQATLSSNSGEFRWLN